jgi:anti-sigma regulatory factor (Ser/Thr protein kinase)
LSSPDAGILLAALGYLISAPANASVRRTWRMATASIALPADLAAADAARTFLSDLLAGQVPPGFEEDAELLTSELVSNSVRHAGLAPDALIRMECDLDLDRLRVTVSDADTPFSSTPPGDLGGWGLVIVAKVSDRWGIHHNDPNSVWFELER